MVMSGVGLESRGQEGSETEDGYGGRARSRGWLVYMGKGGGSNHSRQELPT